MSDPNIVLETPVYHINLTVLLSVVTICLSAMGTLVAVFRKRVKEEDKPGHSPFCAQNKADFQRLETTSKEQNTKLDHLKDDNNKKFEEIRQLLNDTSKEVGILKNESINSTKGIDQMRRDVKDVASKLDDLLKQLLDWMSD